MNYQTNTCRNCGQPQHCGTPHLMEIRSHDDESYQIKSCDLCNCDDCEAVVLGGTTN